jgi:uncharacterized membrane protein YqaE (UPF0057 family)
MRYLLAILLPPIAVLSIGKPIQALLNVGLTLLLWLPGAIHAVLLVNKYYADQRHNETIKALRGQR